MFWQTMNPRWTEFQNKRVWIVGASSGIGAALARAMLARGAEVALSARRESALAEVAAGHERARIVPLDVTDPGAWKEAHARLLEKWPGIDLVVFCAADYRPLRSWELQAEAVRRTVETNLCGVYYGLEVLLGPMLERGQGNLMLIASVAGYMGLPNATVYGPTKAALINLAELLYAELRPRGIGVMLVNPGFVKTRLTAVNRFRMPSLITPESAAEAILKGMSRGRFEIHFPKRFTGWLKFVSILPYRWRVAAVQRAVNLS